MTHGACLWTFPRGFEQRVCQFVSILSCQARCWVFPLEPLCLCPFWVPMEKPSKEPTVFFGKIAHGLSLQHKVSHYPSFHNYGSGKWLPGKSYMFLSSRVIFHFHKGNLNLGRRFCSSMPSKQSSQMPALWRARPRSRFIGSPFVSRYEIPDLFVWRCMLKDYPTSIPCLKDVTLPVSTHQSSVLTSLSVEGECASRLRGVVANSWLPRGIIQDRWVLGTLHFFLLCICEHYLF